MFFAENKISYKLRYTLYILKNKNIISKYFALQKYDFLHKSLGTIFLSCGFFGRAVFIFEMCYLRGC
jgi:hypothetical protein